MKKLLAVLVIICSATALYGGWGGGWNVGKGGSRGGGGDSGGGTQSGGMTVYLSNETDRWVQYEIGVAHENGTCSQSDKLNPFQRNLPVWLSCKGTIQFVEFTFVSDDNLINGSGNQVSYPVVGYTVQAIPLDPAQTSFTVKKVGRSPLSRGFKNVQDYLKGLVTVPLNKKPAPKPDPKKKSGGDAKSNFELDL